MSNLKFQVIKQGSLGRWIWQPERYYLVLVDSGSKTGILVGPNLDDISPQQSAVPAFLTVRQIKAMARRWVSQGPDRQVEIDPVGGESFPPMVFSSVDEDATKERWWNTFSRFWSGW